MIAVIGIGAWLAGLLLLPVPLAARITLAAPLLLVPRLLVSAPVPGVAVRLSGWVALSLALPLLIAFAQPPGPAAFVFALPWMGLCVAAAVGAVWHGVPLLTNLFHPRRASELGGHVALGYLAVGGVFLAFDRLGLRPLDFPASIVLLTATHFHFTGFGLLTVASRMAAIRPALRVPVLGLVAGMPVTALGFVIPSNALGALGALLVGLSGLAVAIALITAGGGDLTAWARRAAGTFLLIGLPMGIAWSWSVWLGLNFVDLDLMVRTHGALNASGVLLAAFALDRVRA